MTRSSERPRAHAAVVVVLTGFGLFAVGCKREAPSGGAPAANDPSAACPPTFLAIPNQASVSHFKCQCKPGFALTPVWGSSPYTRDSSICAAAAHANAIDPDNGGEVEITAKGACSSYEGSTKGGGVTSQKRGKYEPGSFCIDRFGSCDCP